jgi:hypothetical protein
VAGRPRRIVSLVVGLAQCGFGGVASVLSYFIYSNSSLRETLSIASEEIYLYMFVSAVFGVLSLVSGVLLVQQNGRRNS